MREIVDYSTRANGEAGITGALVWTPRYFTQVIEGDEPVVHLLYGRIIRDTRHEEVRLLDVYDAPERAFPDWSLAYSGGTSYVQKRLQHLHAASPGAVDKQSVGSLRSLIHELVVAGGISH